MNTAGRPVAAAAPAGEMAVGASSARRSSH
jgi:hypothetical protein